MQSLLLPVGCSAAALGPSPPHLLLRHRPSTTFLFDRLHLSPLQSLPLSPTSLSSLPSLLTRRRETVLVDSAPVSAGYASPNDDSEKAKLAQVAKRLERTSRYFKRLGGFGFWSQLICTIVAAVILSFSVVITGEITSPATFYSTAGGIVAAFISVFFSFGYIRLSDKLRKTANDPSKINTDWLRCRIHD